MFDDRPALFQAVRDYGLEGIVAKRISGVYRPGYRRWVKIKNPAYWRREAELEGFRRSIARAKRPWRLPSDVTNTCSHD
jgi:ATP-dependent DNA ligase